MDCGVAAEVPRCTARDAPEGSTDARKNGRAECGPKPSACGGSTEFSSAFGGLRGHVDLGAVRISCNLRDVVAFERCPSSATQALCTDVRGAQCPRYEPWLCHHGGDRRRSSGGCARGSGRVTSSGPCRT